MKRYYIHDQQSIEVRQGKRALETIKRKAWVQTKHEGRKRTFHMYCFYNGLPHLVERDRIAEGDGSGKLYLTPKSKVAQAKYWREMQKVFARLFYHLLTTR